MTCDALVSFSNSRRELGRTEAISVDREGRGKANPAKHNAQNRSCLTAVGSYLSLSLACAGVTCTQHAQVAAVRASFSTRSTAYFCIVSARGSSDCSTVESKTRSGVHVRHGIKTARTRGFARRAAIHRSHTCSLLLFDSILLCRRLSYRTKKSQDGEQGSGRFLFIRRRR